MDSPQEIGNGLTASAPHMNESFSKTNPAIANWKDAVASSMFLVVGSSLSSQNAGMSEHNKVVYFTRTQ